MTNPVPSLDNVGAVAEHGRALVAVARDHYDAPVPGCPGWDEADLVAHVGAIWGFVTSVIDTRPDARPDRPVPPDDRAAWAGWAEGNLDDLLAALRDLGPDDDVWNWSVMPNTGAFWPRRMAQETVVHRWDAEQAAGSSFVIPSDLAVDGVDEFFDAFLPRKQGAPVDGLQGSMHLHATDVDGAAGEWFVELEPARFTVRHEHAKGDVAVQGTASDLLLFVWNRIPATADTLAVFGDAGLLERWAAGVRI